jgi:hypothetical protein
VEALEDTPSELQRQQVERWIFEMQLLRNQGHECAKWALQALVAYDKILQGVIDGSITVDDVRPKETTNG